MPAILSPKSLLIYFSEDRSTEQIAYGTNTPELFHSATVRWGRLLKRIL